MKEEKIEKPSISTYCGNNKLAKLQTGLSLWPLVIVAMSGLIGSLLVLVNGAKIAKYMK